MTSPINKFMAAFTRAFNSQVRGIWEIEFSFRSQPFQAWTGRDSSAIHVYDLNGGLFKVIPVRRGMIIEDPEAAAIAAALAAIEQW